MKRFNNILCVLDPEKSSETAIIRSLKIANDHQAAITFSTVFRDAKQWRSFFYRSDKNKENLDEVFENKLSDVISRIGNIAPEINPDVEILSGIGFIEIIKSVINNDYDLVVKCAEDSEWTHRFFSSEDMHLLRKCPCPVLMLKPEQKGVFKKVLATVDVNDDFSQPNNERVQQQLNRKVLDYSIVFCMPELSELHVGSAWEAYAEEFCRHGLFSRVPQEDVDQYVSEVKRECSHKLATLVSDMNSELGKETAEFLKPKVHLVKGKPSREISLMVKEYAADLVVMGTVGRIGIPGLIIGNTAESILEQVQCSVLTIKPDGFQSPVT